MAHTSLYRKYRPATFEDVVGQQHIERTLRNAVAENKVAHAYLFTGPRGTGKTTTARLLAKALLCERGPTAEPDATCEQCIEISEGRHPDVYELDAASRTGVDNVREEIIGRVSFAPTRGRYKVYIIDEVHMLSTAAFNALLKTLEEPPAHVVFVMCTTHPQKVPETIQSRCQRFDFRRLSVEDIADRLRYIAEAEGIKVDRSAFSLIARHAEGGMRDAITALEQLAAFTGDEITSDDVEGMLGQVDSSQLFEIGSLVARRDIGGAFKWVADIVETGTDLFELVREFTSHVRDLFVMASVRDAEAVIDRTADEMPLLRAQADEFGGPERLGRVLDLLGELAGEMRWSSDPRLSLEVALTRMARPQGEMTLEALAERIEALELRLADGSFAPPVPRSAPAPAPTPAKASEAAAPEPVSAPAPKSPKQSKPAASAAEADPAPVAPVADPVPAPAPVAASGAGFDTQAVKRGWRAVLAEIKKVKPGRVQTFSGVEVDVDVDGVTLVLEFPASQSFSMQLAEETETRELLRKALVAVFGSAPPFRYQLGRGAVRPVEPLPEDEPSIAAAVAAPPESGFEPIPEYYEYDSDEAQFSAPSDVSGEGASDLRKLLTDGLGATIVAEHHHEPEGEEA